MKNAAHWFVCFLTASGFFLGLPSLTQAGTLRVPPHKPPPKTVYTAIASVDTKAMTITVEPKNSTATATKTYSITPGTRITVGGKPATLADLRPGLQIHVGAGADANVAEELAATDPPADPK